MQEKKLTGYPSIDKPWLKYYSEEAINAPLPECTIYEYMLENNKNHPDDIALIYFNRKITYGELFENINKTASALLALGVKPGEIVTVPCLPANSTLMRTIKRSGGKMLEFITGHRTVPCLPPVFLSSYNHNKKAPDNAPFYACKTEYRMV